MKRRNCSLRQQIRSRCRIIVALLSFCGLSPGLGREGQELLKTNPAEWRVVNWINSPPLSLASLRGHVVLVRWWTAPGCPYCAATAPALNELHELYGQHGLVVVGFYHHKSTQPFAKADVVAEVNRFGFKFPVAIDPEWQTLKKWWLDSGDRAFTSVSFLIDKSGRIQYIHPGGEYAKDSADYRLIKSKIERLLRAR